MIQTMKKVHIIGLSNKQDDSIRDLKELGLIHVSTKLLNSLKMDELRLRQNTLRRALVLLSSYSEKVDFIATENDFDQVITRILDLGEQIKSLDDKREKLEKEKQRIAVWGVFEPEMFDDLCKSSQVFGLYFIPVKDLTKIKSETKYMVCFKDKIRAGIVLFSDPNLLPESAELFDLPTASLPKIEAEIQSALSNRTKTIEAVKALSPFYSQIEQAIQDIEGDLEEALVTANVEDHDGISVLEGYIPENQLEDLRKWAGEKAWGFAVSDPEPDDPVPTLLKNPKPVRILKPILDFLGTVPGYKERDISHWFLLFLTIFFSMIIGDAFYGLILLTISGMIALSKGLKKQSIPLFVPLLALFSVATISWGAITGNWLGLDKKYLPEFLLSLQVPFLTNPESGSKNVQWLCFIIGLVHLLLAHVLRFFAELKKKPHIHAFAQLGWASVIFGAFWLVLNVVLDSEKYPVPEFATTCIAIGMALVFIFEKQEAGQNFFVGIAKALGNVITTALSGVSAFADVISYIRLFAVGLAGLAIAQSFNSMAQGAFDGGGAGVLIGILIMIFGHTLNLVMGALSVVVHGIRLNMLEYSSHIGLEWSGFAYKPFKKAA